MKKAPAGALGVDQCGWSRQQGNQARRALDLPEADFSLLALSSCLADLVLLPLLDSALAVALSALDFLPLACLASSRRSALALALFSPLLALSALAVLSDLLGFSAFGAIAG